MSYKLSGSDRDAIHGFVISGTVQPALDFVESLIQKELEAASGKTDVPSTKESAKQNVR